MAAAAAAVVVKCIANPASGYIICSASSQQAWGVQQHTHGALKDPTALSERPHSAISNPM